MTRADMDRVRDDFVRSARFAAEAGFDWLELHCAHGYLLSCFISPLTNRRDDDYGGTLANRLRYPLEVFAAVREVWPQHLPMSVRISAHDWVEGGITPDDAVEIARAFKAAGADMIDCSSGQVSAKQQPTYGRMYQTPFADRIRNEAGIATIAVGAISEADHVNSIVAAGRADLCAVGRPHLANPAWTLMEAARIGYVAQPWPKQYLAAKAAARTQPRARACTGRRWRPPSRRTARWASDGEDGHPEQRRPRLDLPRLLGEDSIGHEARAVSGDHLALKVWLRLLACSTQIETEIRKRLRSRFGMTLPRFDYLAQLYRHPEGLRMNVLSRYLMVTGGNVTGLTDELEKDGLVMREVDPSRPALVSHLPDRAPAGGLRAHRRRARELARRTVRRRRRGRPGRLCSHSSASCGCNSRSQASSNELRRQHEPHALPAANSQGVTRRPR